MKPLKNCSTTLMRSLCDQALISTLSIILLLTIFTLPVITTAQDSRWEWVKTMSGSNAETGESIVIDKNGNIYTLGTFRSTVDFDPGPDTHYLTSKWTSDVFISKLDSTGQFLWVKSIGGNSVVFGKSLAVDTFENIYILGEFNSITDFDPGPEVFFITGAGHLDVFVCKLNSEGEFKWAKSIGGPENDAGADIRIDASGNLYITGSFIDTCGFGPDGGSFTSSSKWLPDIFISKLDNLGSFEWVKVVGGQYYDEGTTIAVDHFGNVYTSGYFNDNVDFDPGPGVFILDALGEFNVSAFISKLDSSGKFVWAKSIGGYGALCNSTSISVDALSNVYITGNFWGGKWGLTFIDLDPGAGGFYFTVPPVADIFMVKLSASGDFDWAKQIGNEGWDSANAIAVDDTGSIYITGLFTGTVDFDPAHQAFWLSSEGATDLFISKLDSEGNFIWAAGAGGSNNDYASSIALDADGYAYVTGGFESGNIKIDTFVIQNQALIDLPDAFIIKVNNNEEKCQITATHLEIDVLCHGDATGSISLDVFHGAEPITYLWSNGGTTATNSGLQIGKYAVTFSDANACEGSFSFTISEPPPIDIDIIAVSPSSESGSGRIWITVTGGTAGYSYHWIDPLGAVLLTEDLDNLTVSGYYALTVTDANGCAKTIDPIFVDQVSATTQSSPNSTVLAYPVPAKDEIYLDLNIPIAEVLIFASDGRLCRRILKPDGNRLNVKDLGDGMYFLCICEGSQWYTARIFK